MVVEDVPEVMTEHSRQYPVLDSKVWPQDVHDFVGDVVDILDEQLELADVDERQQAARDLLDLLAEPDLVIRTWAVVGIRRALRILGDDPVKDALERHAVHLTEVPEHGRVDLG